MNSVATRMHLLGQFVLAEGAHSEQARGQLSQSMPTIAAHPQS